MVSFSFRHEKSLSDIAAERSQIDILTNALVTDLFSDDDKRILGVKVLMADGEIQEIGCDALILACCGVAGNSEMVEEYMPEIKEAEFFGHPGNKGDAIKWGKWLVIEKIISCCFEFIKITFEPNFFQKY